MSVRSSSAVHERRQRPEKDATIAAGDRIAGATGAGDMGAIAAFLPVAATTCCTTARATPSRSSLAAAASSCAARREVAERPMSILIPKLNRAEPFQVRSGSSSLFVSSLGAWPGTLAARSARLLLHFVVQTPVLTVGVLTVRVQIVYGAVQRFCLSF